jgi:hypothetical protein
MKIMNVKVAIVVGTLVSLPMATFAQEQNSFRERPYTRTVAGKWTGPRLPDDRPDVQGHWSNTIGNHNNLSDPNGGLPGDRRRNDRPERPRSERAPSRVTDPADGQCRCDTSPELPRLATTNRISKCLSGFAPRTTGRMAQSH